MTADIGQQQWSCTIFRLSNRTLISRVRIFMIWQKSVEFQTEARLLVAAWIWAISWHGGPVQTAGTVRERAAHKSRAAWAFSSLGDYKQDSSHLRGSERAHQPDQWAGCLLFQFRQLFYKRGFFTRRGDFNARKDSIVRLIFSKRKDFSIRLIFSKSKGFSICLVFSKSTDFSIRLIFSKSKDFSIRWFLVKAGISQSAWFFLAASICTYFRYFIFLHSLLSMRQYLIGANISGL